MTTCHGRSVCVPAKSPAEAFSPRGKASGHEGGAPTLGSVPIGRATGGDICLPCEDTASKGPSADQEESLPATEWASAGTWTSRTVRVNACR